MGQRLTSTEWAKDNVTGWPGVIGKVMIKIGMKVVSQEYVGVKGNATRIRLAEINYSNVTVLT